jgi:hypothetical protein
VDCCEVEWTICSLFIQDSFQNKFYLWIILKPLLLVGTLQYLADLDIPISSGTWSLHASKIPCSVALVLVMTALDEEVLQCLQLVINTVANPISYFQFGSWSSYWCWICWFLMADAGVRTLRIRGNIDSGFLDVLGVGCSKTCGFLVPWWYDALPMTSDTAKDFLKPILLDRTRAPLRADRATSWQAGKAKILPASRPQIDWFLIF